MTEPHNKVMEFERALERAKPQKVTLRLYVAGMGPRSTRAIADLKRLCDAFGERFSAEIVDIYEQPRAATAAQIVAVPTLVREHPLPRRTLIGTNADIFDVARTLGLAPRTTGAA